MTADSAESSLRVSELTPAVEEKLATVRAIVSGLERVVVAFSGGVDSAFMLRVAYDVLGDDVLALTARSPSLMHVELEDAVALAKEIGVRHEIVETRELDRAGYVSNAPARCYHCKTELFDAALLRSHAFLNATVIDGFNADDFRDHTHGHRAALEHGVRHPLAEAQLSKPEIRGLSRALGLRTWKKPQLACLSSRIPHGMEVTRERLGRVEVVEVALRRLGFFDVRARLVRENDDMVRLEVGEQEIERVVDRDVRTQIVAAARSAGFRFIALDLEGFRSGRLSEVAGSDGGVIVPLGGVRRSRR
jgi:pyridinium-3,5-biscarboxylic acid mononucleotide sulfurtransferase